MTQRSEGLTSIYNKFNDQKEVSDDIVYLRNLHCELDIEVANAYGWIDLIGKDRTGLKHGFHETKVGTRWVIHPDVALLIIDRLLLLNNERYIEELASGKHVKITKTNSTRVVRPKVVLPEQQGLDFDASPIAHQGDISIAQTAIRDHLRSRLGLHSKADILSATGVADGQWNGAINDLIARGQVIRQGEKRGARYRANS